MKKWWKKSKFKCDVVFPHKAKQIITIIPLDKEVKIEWSSVSNFTLNRQHTSLRPAPGLSSSQNKVFHTSKTDSIVLLQKIITSGKKE